jgi:hypothetical protein
MIFNTINLDLLTCIQKFEVPLQLTNRTKMEISKKSSYLNLKPFKLWVYCRKHCRYTVSATVTQRVL